MKRSDPVALGRRVLNVRLPDPLRSFVDMLRFVNFDLGLAPVSCVFSYSYYPKLLVNTLVPLGLVVAILSRTSAATSTGAFILVL